jgi:uncharacterized protein with NRDE domain
MVIFNFRAVTVGNLRKRLEEALGLSSGSLNSEKPRLSSLTSKIIEEIQHEQDEGNELLINRVVKLN